jgi:energy-coupling factor transporter ATP-binding protein EcfA2
METLYADRLNIPIFLRGMYAADKMLVTQDRMNLNLAFLDMLNPEDFVGTIIASDTPAQYLQRMERALALATSVHNLVRMFHAHGTSAMITTDVLPSCADLDRVQAPHQLLLDFLLQVAGNRRLRRTETAMYRPKLLLDGTPTGFFEYECEISEFVFRAVSPDRLHPTEYDALTNRPSTPGQMVFLLGKVHDARCLFMAKHRSLFSFRNGIFDARNETFQAHGTNNDQKLSSSQYFDWHVDEETLTMSPKDIPTPNFEKILMDQDMDTKARFWLYALCGRMLHDVGSLDDWQVCLYIRGVAGSGKSTILKVLAMFYESDSVGYLMSDGQSVFSDEHLYDKFMNLAMDIDKRTSFNVTRFNSMVSGEHVSVNRKNKTSLNMKWTAPLAMASNSQPPFVDVGGNLMRRFVIYLFDNRIKNSDPLLFDKLRLEVPLLLLKMSRSYLEAIRLYGDKSVWDKDILPEMCHKSKRQYVVATNPVAAFLDSDHVEYIPQEVTMATGLRRRMTTYAKENSDRGAAAIGIITAVDHGHLFAMHGCSIEERTLESGAKHTVVVGLRLVEDLMVM